MVLLVPTVLLLACASQPSSDLRIASVSSSWLQQRGNPVFIYVLDGTTIGEAEIDLIRAQIQAGNPHVVIQDGRPIHYENPDSILGRLDPEEDIESITVYKGAGAVARFGPRTEDGVFIVILKSGDRIASETPALGGSPH